MGDSTRGSSMLAGFLLMALAAALAVPPAVALAVALGTRPWPFALGFAAVLLLLFGRVERFWRSRPPRRPRAAHRSRFRVLRGGKGNGHAHDLERQPGAKEGDKPTWLM